MLEKVDSMTKPDGAVSQSADEDGFYRPAAGVGQAAQSAVLQDDG